MKNLEILKTRKGELIEKTIELMPQALSGDRANRTFYFIVDEETDELTVDYLYYLGQVQLSDNCFFTIKDYETPADPEDFGYESTEEEIDFDFFFYDEIEFAIDNKIADLEGMYI